MLQLLVATQSGLKALTAALFLMAFVQPAESAEFERRVAKQWYPFVEWQVDDVTVADAVNPFDVVAWVVFEHEASGEAVRTGMFYDGDGTWKFRFTGTKVGRWTFTTSSEDAAELDGLDGSVEVEPNDDAVLGRGFVTSEGHQWTWSGNGRAFVPQLVMGASIDVYHQDPGGIDADIHRWYVEHGFNGMHTGLAMRWYDLPRDSRSPSKKRGLGPLEKNPNPDPRTFAALERLITSSYEAGGMVHLWQWGDENRGMTPIGLAGGINGEADRRLQRYIAARLGALPGWTMGYGFDLWEWVDEDQLLAWHAYMHEQLGWPHLLGGRIHRHGTPLEDLMTDRLDYIGYETHQPDLSTYTKALKLYPNKPVFMEDRFRVRAPSPYPDKDYTPEMVRRGLWRSLMAGGVANIWGYQPRETGESKPFPNREQIKTYSTFHDRYYRKNMLRDDDRANGACLRARDSSVLLFYFENEQTLQIDLGGVAGEPHAVAVNAQAAYKEIDIGGVSGVVNWTAPAKGDWAVAVTTQAENANGPGQK